MGQGVIARSKGRGGVDLALFGDPWTVNNKRRSILSTCAIVCSTRVSLRRRSFLVPPSTPLLDPPPPPHRTCEVCMIVHTTTIHDTLP